MTHRIHSQSRGRVASLLYIAASLGAFSTRADVTEHPGCRPAADQAGLFRRGGCIALL